MREAADYLTQIIAPMMPHLAEECWSALGHAHMVAEMAWPKADHALIVENDITIPIQINGKKRGEITISREADNKTVEAAVLALEAIQLALEGKPVKKVVVVPQRIVNVVI